MKFENTQVFNFEGAFRGMRNPKNSWDKSDSDFSDDCHNQSFDEECEKCEYFLGFDVPCKAHIGENDMKLAQSLIRGGSEHRKFMRQIFVSVDITAPLYWWKEFDTYKVGTVANSTSTMHKMASKPITLDCFEIDDYDNSLSLIDDVNIGLRVDCFIDDLEQLRQIHLHYLSKSKKKGISESDKEHYEQVAKKYWKELIRWLPESWLQTRTVTMSYENLLAMCSKGQRRFHKLNEWSGKDDNNLTNFISWARTLPYAQELIFIDENSKGDCCDEQFRR